MSDVELRVHAAASGIVQMDTRYRNIAQKIMNFEPAKKTVISDVIMKSKRSDAPGQSASFSSEGEHSSASDASRPREQQPRNVSSGAQNRSYLKRKRNVGNNIPFKRSKQGLNPAYKAPLPTKIQVNAVETPRPGSAPEKTVLVPFTVSPKLQRSRSDESQARLTESLSPLEGRESSRVDETSLLDTSPTSEQRARSSGATFGLTNNSFETHRFPGNQEQLAALRKGSRQEPNENEVTWQLSQTSLDEADLTMGTRRREEDLRDDDQETSPDHLLQKSQSTERTASVSPSEMRKFQSSSSFLHRPANAPIPTPVIDLTHDSEEPSVGITHRDLLGPVSSPVRDFAPSGEFEEVFTKIKGLSKHTYCAATNTITNQPFKSCITPGLAELAQRFDLQNSFQLYAATGNVNNRTRGYWQLLISIDDVASSARTHASSFTSSQWVDRRFMVRQEGEVDALATTPEREAFIKQTKYPPKDPTKPVAWNMNVFLNFWAILTKAVERGRAGYDSFLEINRRDRTEHGIFVKIRVWCWSEALAHTWLLLYAASNGMVANMPVQWFVPNFKKHGIVLTMSGQPKNPGDIGRWVERSSGPNGYWGLEQTWDGIESAETRTL